MRKASKTLAEDNAFTYWLFKMRVGRSDAARTASDTRKGLRMLEELRGTPVEHIGGVVPSAGNGR